MYKLSRVGSRFVIAGAFIGLLFLAHIFTTEFSAQAILTGSMSPALEKNALVITWKDRHDNYQVGQVVTYVREVDTGLVYITHRVTAKQIDESRSEYLVTQGDANTNGDGWRVYPSQILGRVIISIPFLGYMSSQF